MQNCKLIIGPPGTGKTTRLLDIVDERFDRGYKPEEIAYVSFTRKAADEAVDRAMEKFGLDRKRLKYFRTLHSIAFKELKLQREDVLSKDDMQTLAEFTGMEFSDGFDTNDWRWQARYTSQGDQCFQAYSLSRAKQTDIWDEYKKLEYFNIPRSELEHFSEVYESFKKTYEILDFSDFLDYSDFKLPVRTFILDEAQDLTRQQWGFVSRISEAAEEVIVAGDDDQAIYAWSGADLDYFLHLKGEKELLDYSYRLPKKIYDFSQDIIKNVRNRYEKSFIPREDEQGKIEHIYYLNELDIDQGSWLLLARENRFLTELIQFARDKGVVYQHKGAWSNESGTVRAVLSYEAMRQKGKEVTAKELKQILAQTVGVEFPETKKDSYIYSDVDWGIKKDGTWIEVLDRLPIDEREYIRALRRNDESLVLPGRVVISTIHGAKGGADNVLLHCKAGKKVEAEMVKDFESECRVWYVGVTRARSSLYIYDTTRFLNKVLYF